MADTTPDFNSIAGITTALQTYVVAPLNAFGLGGFVFNLQGEDTATLSSDITDHYSENNTFLQDHIAIKPKRITLRGYVGELIYNASGQSPTVVQTVTQKLTQIAAFLPAMGAAATQAQAAIASVSGATGTTGTLDALAGAIPATANIYGLVTNLLGTVSGDTKNQQSAYQYFAACQSTGTLMGIQTPWEFLTNMAVETIVAIQSEDSIFVTDFAITFKQMRFASIATVTATSALTGTGGQAATTPPICQGACAAQVTSVVNQGTNIGEQIAPAAATAMFNSGVFN